MGTGISDLTTNKTMENNHQMEGCPCCGSLLSLIHYRGCPNSHIEWHFKKDMSSMPIRNVEALLELEELISNIPPPGPDHLLECEKP